MTKDEAHCFKKGELYRLNDEWFKGAEALYIGIKRDDLLLCVTRPRGPVANMYCIRIGTMMLFNVCWLEKVKKV